MRNVMKTLQKTLVVSFLVSSFIMAIAFVHYYSIPWEPLLLSCNCNNQYSVNQLKNFDSLVTITSTKTIYVITPTYKRITQKIDLTSMCHTLMHVSDLVWIVIEDAPEPTNLVTRLLQHCKVKSVHLVVPTSAKFIRKEGKSYWSKPRGVDQRNAGLKWLRENFNSSNCSGVFYFGDDDNKYDLRLFDEIRQTQVASVWKVAWAGGLMWSGPICRKQEAISWHAVYAPDRKFPVDMAGFAVHLCQLFKHPRAEVGINIQGKNSMGGRIETDFLEHFTNRSKVECRGSENETYVWHSHTKSPTLRNENKEPTGAPVEL